LRLYRAIEPRQGRNSLFFLKFVGINFFGDSTQKTGPANGATVFNSLPISPSGRSLVAKVALVDD